MRSSGGVRRHSGKAEAAASTAAFTSGAPASGTLARISPVAGLITSRHSVACDSAQVPLMWLVSLVMGGAARVVMICDAFRCREEWFVVINDTAWLLQRGGRGRPPGRLRYTNCATPTALLSGHKHWRWRIRGRLALRPSGRL